ncbi:MAG: sigma 54-interacting transcriptional regulator, partial [Firmicutes bacterium]|nr:sigma 54-interacting transcriptional regulator [Bacillota bacterium]
SHKIDVRILAATNVDLVQKVKEKSFRKDLFFRLNVVPIFIPPLRERPEDIIPLIQRFQRKFEQQYGIKKQLGVEALDRLLQYEWPGNVRELENIVEFLYVTVGGPVIRPEDLPFQVRERNGETREKAVMVNSIIPLKKAVYEIERELIRRAMEQCGSTSKVAALLKVDQSTVVRKMQRYKRAD